jgi:hypothetical protein
LIALVYGIAALVALPGGTIGWWGSEERFIAVWVFIILFYLALFSGTSFALAAVAWATWSFRGRPAAERMRAWTALLVALLTFSLCAGYLLVMTGVVRLNRI